MEIYILGGYLAILIYTFLLDNSKKFLDYMTQLMEIVINIASIKKVHPYTLITVFGMFLLFSSWIGILCLLFLIVDFIKTKKNMNYGIL